MHLTPLPFGTPHNLLKRRRRRLRVWSAPSHRHTVTPSRRSFDRFSPRPVIAAMDKNKTNRCESTIDMFKALMRANAELQVDREIVLTTVKKDGGVIQYAAAAFKADREIMLAAVQQDGNALAYAAPALKADREVELAAVATVVMND